MSEDEIVKNILQANEQQEVQEDENVSDTCPYVYKLKQILNGWNVTL